MQDPVDTRFAKVGDVHIAYQVVGEGPVDILFIDTWVHHVEAVWDFPESPAYCAGSHRSAA